VFGTQKLAKSILRTKACEKYCANKSLRKIIGDKKGWRQKRLATKKAGDKKSWQTKACEKYLATKKAGDKKFRILPRTLACKMEISAN
jgi:hypothetical protein